MHTKKVKIKTWEQLAEEFGGGETFSINCQCGFPLMMNNALPEDRIIDVTSTNGHLMWEGWEVSQDMIEEEVE